MKLVLIGIQGAGKSTQGNLLSKQLHIPYLSTGHIFREIAKEKTKLGRYVKELITTGTLVPDDRVIEIVSEYLSRSEYENGYILDGFPRTLTQAKKFSNNVDKVIEVRISDKEALWRLAYRDDDRDDNTIRAIRTRIETFHKYTIPVLEYYDKQDKLVTIDGTKEIDEVNEEILKNLGKQLIKNHVQNWKKKQKTIIGIVGLPGSGKSEATEFLRSKDLPTVSFSNVVNDTIDKKGLSHTNDVHSKVRMDLRKRHGFAAMAILSKEAIEQALEENVMVVIEGLRSWEEYLQLKQDFPKARIVIVGMFAPKKVRYDRIKKRKERSHVGGEERDIKELEELHCGPTIAFADYLVVNSGSKTELEHQLEEVYRSVYFD